METLKSKEKSSVALWSILAAILMTAGKLVVGLLTRSLGILSEALHSGLDLVAAIMTYFSVKYSDKPADKEHNYGHHKMENLSALAQTIILLGTCTWVIYEAVVRLMSGYVNVEVNYWSFGVIITSILIDWNRSHQLMKVAKKYNSEALKADALHFSTDILSSIVVLVGLVGILIGFPIADAIASLVVAGIVIYICYGMIKTSTSVLLDATDISINEKVVNIVNGIEEIKFMGNLKSRISGSEKFIEFSISVDENLSVHGAHLICDKVEEIIQKEILNSHVIIHVTPEF